MSKALVTTVSQGESSRAGSAVPLAWTCLVSSAFYARPVSATLEDCEESRSISVGSRHKFICEIDGKGGIN